ncbi:hypothetical protein [Embleya scabrispora]|uniref:hypothetical protein n=1 Tax=Embleya scabrispora TaxID=159449 RepID=UPI0003AA40D1|nr:hypothetical protein [Embleya scabrispora]MYS86875.1 hypothetical protein [Streptomyces sp. SID5474]
MKRRIATGLVAVAAFAACSGTAVASAAPAAPSGQVSVLGSCPETRNVSVNGGEAHWTVWCSGGRVYVDGYVKDTKADGKCAEVYGSVGSVAVNSANACPKNTKKTFAWNAPGSSVALYLRLI